MATLFFGAAKGFGSLMGMGALLFGFAVNRIEVQMEEIELDAVEVQELVPLPAE